MARDLDDLLRETLRARIDERGWSLRKTAERLSQAGWPVTHPIVQRLLNGTRKITAAEWLMVAQALSEPPLHLLLPPGSRQLPLSGQSIDRDRLAAWISGETPLDTVPDPDHYRRAAGRPSTRRGTEYAALLRHMADVYDASSDSDRADVALNVIGYSTGVLQALRMNRQRRRGAKRPAMANLDTSERTPRTKRRRQSSNEKPEG